MPGPAPLLRLEEDWTGGIDAERWRFYGEPFPEIVHTDDGRPAMRNNGDDKYPSGVVTVGRYATGHGLAIQWLQRTPLTGDFWQEIWVNVTDLELQDFRQGDGTPFDHERSIANVSTPILNYQPPIPQASIGCRRHGKWFSFEDAFSRTEWHSVELQIYPSGGCDLRVDGALVGRIVPAEPVALPDSVRIVFGGRSHNADILIGELSVWEGIVVPGGK
jgi:hypothetical protein